MSIHNINRVDGYTQMMLERTPVGMAVYTAQDLCLCEANPAFLAILDTFLDPCWQQGKAIGQPITLWGIEAPDILNIFRTVAETGISYRKQEYLLVTAKGITYWDWALEAVRDHKEHITHLVHTLIEVTEHVQTHQRAEQVHSALRKENSLVEAERKRLEVIETVARCVQVSLDTTHIAQTAINAIRTHFHAQTACLHIADPTQRVMRLLCAYDPPGAAEILKPLHNIPYERMAKTSQVLYQRDPIVTEDLQVAARTGKIAEKHPLVLAGLRGYICVPLWFGDHLEGTLCASFAQSISADGAEVSALVGSGIHIAAALAHARLHAIVEQEQNRLRAILDQLPEGILIAEVSDGAISYANPTATNMLGVPCTIEISSPQYGQAQRDGGTTLDGQYIPPWNFVVIRALCGETIRSKETLVITPDGKRSVILTSGAPLYRENGIITGAVIVFQDVTAQKSLEQHKNEFLSIVNHELRTPITIIEGFAEILHLKMTQEYPLDTFSQYALTNISEQSEHLTRLIEELLDISRIEQSQFVLHRAPHDLLSIIKRVIGSQAITTRQHLLHLTLEGLEPTDTLRATIDERHIVQVFNNLVSNAIKYSPTGGDIEIGLQLIPSRVGEVLIWVKDQGIGIAANEMPHIFKRFHRARNIDHSLSGFGIGLYLVKEVVTRHGGRVWVESIEGQGSTFSVLLPLNNPPI